MQATVHPTCEVALAALHEQADCYRRLSKLAEAQHDHVEQSRTDALLEVLRHRAVEVERIGQLETLLAPLRRAWSEVTADWSVEQRATAESIIAEIRLLLERINASDRSDSLILQQRKLSVGKQLQQAGTARGVSRSYAAAAYGKPPPRMDVQR
jgi:hypothetical protein